jgi:hypothetical protein
MAKRAAAKTEARMRPKGTSAEEHLEEIEPAAKRDDAKALDRMMRRVTGKGPTMWGASIIGYGKVHYKYDSGHEGDMPEAGFAARKANLVVYVTEGFDGQRDLLARLGKHKATKGCLYINKLADVDLKILEEIAARCVRYVRKKYPTP